MDVNIFKYHTFDFLKYRILEPHKRNFKKHIETCLKNKAKRKKKTNKKK
jgi:hypothetical protein